VGFSSKERQREYHSNWQRNKIDNMSDQERIAHLMYKQFINRIAREGDYYKEYYAKNNEKMKQSNREYKKRNPKKVSAYKNKWRVKNRQKYLDQKRKDYYKSNYGTYAKAAQLLHELTTEIQDEKG